MPILALLLIPLLASVAIASVRNLRRMETGYLAIGGGIVSGGSLAGGGGFEIRARCLGAAAFSTPIISAPWWRC